MGMAHTSCSQHPVLPSPRSATCQPLFRTTRSPATTCRLCLTPPPCPTPCTTCPRPTTAPASTRTRQAASFLWTLLPLPSPSRTRSVLLLHRLLPWTRASCTPTPPMPRLLSTRAHKQFGIWCCKPKPVLTLQLESRGRWWDLSPPLFSLSHLFFFFSLSLSPSFFPSSFPSFPSFFPVLLSCLPLNDCFCVM